MKPYMRPPLLAPAERAEVIELARRVGAAEAAKAHGLKAATVRQWLSRAGRTTTLAEHAARVSDVLPAEVVEAALAEVVESTLRTNVARMVDTAAAAELVELALAEVDALPTTAEGASWQERAPVVGANLGRLVEVAIAATMKAVLLGKTRQARELATVVGITFDKAQLLAGGATSRTEARTEARTLSMHSLQITGDTDQVAAELRALRADLGLPAPAAVEVAAIGAGPIDATATDDDQEEADGA